MTVPEASRDPATIRSATSADREEIARILRQLHPAEADGSTLPRVRQDAQTFVATYGERLVGVAVVTLVDYGFAAYGTVEELVVDAASRRHGTGAGLLEQCRSWLATAGVDVVFVSALDDEVANFYIGAGFARCTGPWLYWVPGRDSAEGPQQPS